MSRNGNDPQQQLLQIQPKQLKFVFELGKQSSCSVLLTNNTYHYVAFKVKTTSPKSYCVRPNIGIIEPKSSCEFIVILQTQKIAVPDMICKDKFLIQSAVVPAETTGKDITSAMFVKDIGKYVNEVKLRVALISPSESPVASPINGVLKQGPFSEGPVFNGDEIPPLSQKDVERKKLNDQVFSTARDVEMKPKKDMVPSEESRPSESAEFKKLNGQLFSAAKEVEMKPQKDTVDSQEPKVPEVANGAELLPMMQFFNGERLKPATDEELKLDKDAINDCQQKAAKDEKSTTSQAEKELKSLCVIEEMKSKLGSLESKLNEAEVTISKLTEERRLTIQERTKLQEELAVLKSGASVKRVQNGFPLLFLVMVAFISIMVGYLLHA